MSKTFEGGWTIPWFGRKFKRSAMRASHANDLVGPLNALGRMSIVRGNLDKVIYSDYNIILQLGGGGGGGGTEPEPPPETGEACVATIVTVGAGYLACTKIVNSSPINVAFPFELRTTPSDTPTPEIYPTYTAGDEIVAIKVVGQTAQASAPDWIDANVDCRRWARYLELCNDKYALFHCSDLRNV